MEVAAEKTTSEMMMRFEETELRLGLPGNGGSEVVVGSSCVRKRGFSETVDLQLNLSSSTTANKLEPPPAAGKLLQAATPTPTSSSVVENKMEKSLDQSQNIADPDPAKPPAKAQVVGWPPVRSFRKNMVASVKTSAINTNNNNNNNNLGSRKDKDHMGSAAESDQVAGAGSFVKVSMDGAPYLRKVDLKMYASYKQLSDALAKMFNSFSTTTTTTTTANEAAAAAAGGSIMKDFMNDGANPMCDNNNSTDNHDYVPTYEDKDGDWMLVGDVPWEMFAVSCNRLRIMKGKDATIGLAPRGMEKRKNRARA